MCIRDSADTESFGYWYLQFNRSPDVIDYLVDYCANHCKGKLNMKFIDSVAQSWHQKGLHTLDAIRQYNLLHNDTVYAIMKAYGLYNQTPAPAQLCLLYTSCEYTVAFLEEITADISL